MSKYPKTATGPFSPAPPPVSTTVSTATPTFPTPTNPDTVPPGGALGAILTKSSASDFALSWTTREAMEALLNFFGTALPTNALAATFMRGLPLSDGAVPTTQRQSFVRIRLRAGVPVTNIVFVSGATAAGTPTNQFFTLYDASRNKLAVTADDTTTAWAANTAKPLAIAGGPYTPATTADYYLGIMVKATTPPTLAGLSSFGAAVNGLAPIVSGYDGTNTTLTNPASAPATAAALTAAAVVPYAYVT